MIETKEEELPTPLKDAIRDYWHAHAQHREAQRGKQVPHIVAFYQEQIGVQELLVIQLQKQTTTFVLTGDECNEMGGEQIDLGTVDVLLQKRIIHECLACEERADLTDCYGGDHREFHLSGDHHEACINKALHEYDPVRWPTYEPPKDEFDTCEECGITLA